MVIHFVILDVLIQAEGLNFRYVGCAQKKNNKNWTWYLLGMFWVLIMRLFVDALIFQREIIVNKSILVWLVPFYFILMTSVTH